MTPEPKTIDFAPNKWGEEEQGGRERLLGFWTFRVAICTLLSTLSSTSSVARMVVVGRHEKISGFWWNLTFAYTVESSSSKAFSNSASN
jgi:hypothetical protein